MNRPTGWNIKAILLGLATDIFGSQIGLSVVAIPMAIALAQSGMSPQQIAARLTSLPMVLILFMIVGLIFTTIGGFVSAHVAGRDEVRHATATGTLSLVTTLAVMAFTPVSLSWYNVLSLLLAVPCAALGGLIRSKRPRGEKPNSGNPPIPEP